MSGQASLFNVLLAIAAVLLLVGVNSASETMEMFDPFARLGTDPPPDLLKDKCKLLKKAILAIRYERRMKLLQAAQDIKHLAIAASFFLALVLWFEISGKMGALEKWLFASVAYLTPAVLAVLNLHLKKMRVEIDRL